MLYKKQLILLRQTLLHLSAYSALDRCVIATRVDSHGTWPLVVIFFFSIELVVKVAGVRMQQKKKST